MSDSALRERIMESIHVALPKVLSLDTDAAAGFSESTRLMDDLGMTSVVTMELILELEDALEIQIDIEEMEPADVGSISALADYVAGHMVIGLAEFRSPDPARAAPGVWFQARPVARAVGDAFCATRLGGDRGHAYGTAPRGLNPPAIIARAAPNGQAPLQQAQSIHRSNSDAPGW
jgi:acyl carrier protein